ncbi:hypothetical protein [Paenibacillus hamazuiensis]|uniref:hypothetical protein n=1 Tax=Paenibacillus hamazuiensis TaxID=2936508 RepID=UPI00200DEB3A|nr:hypothetical protein [Paenibacillus hamazuiensis]
MFVSLLIAWSSMFLLALSLFRIKPGHYKLPIVISSLLASSISICIQFFQVPFLTAILQPIVMILCLILAIKLKVIHAMLLTVITYSFAMTGETVYNLILAALKNQSFVANLRENVTGPLIVTGIVNLAVAYILNWSRTGFSFISINDVQPVSGAFKNYMLAFLIISLFLMGSTSYSLYHFGEVVIFIHSLVILVLIMLLEWSYRKEMAEAGASEI